MDFAAVLLLQKKTRVIDSSPLKLLDGPKGAKKWFTLNEVTQYYR